MPSAADRRERRTPAQRTKRDAAKGAGTGRRQEYIDAAATIFSSRGYGTATIGDLADALGVTKAAVYYYVDSKEDLLYEIIREMHLLNLANLEAADSHRGSARTRLWQYFRGHAHINLQYLEKTTVVYRDLDHLSPERRTEIVALRDRTQTFVRELLAQGAAEGEVCTLLEVGPASIQMFATANAVYSWYHLSGPVDVDDMARDVTDFVVAAVSCSGPGDRSCPRHHPVGEA